MLLAKVTRSCLREKFLGLKLERLKFETRKENKLKILEDNSGMPITAPNYHDSDEVRKGKLNFKPAVHASAP